MVAHLSTVHIVSDGWLAALGVTQRGSFVMIALHGGMRGTSGGSLVTYSSCSRLGRTFSASSQTTTWDVLLALTWPGMTSLACLTCFGMTTTSHGADRLTLMIGFGPFRRLYDWRLRLATDILQRSWISNGLGSPMVLLNILFATKVLYIDNLELINSHVYQKNSITNM